MEIRFYTPELNMIGVMENQTSLLWTRKFVEPGTFQLVAPITDYNIHLCKLGNILSVEGAVEAAVVEAVTIRQNDLRRTIQASGRMLSSYLDRRLIRPRMNFTGTYEVAMRRIISDIEYPIPLLELGDFHGYTETITFQATYKNVLTYLTKLAKGSNIGFRIRPDFTEKKLTFETYKGYDHSDTQTERTRVVFSEEYQNISTTKYQEDDRNYKNVIWAGGRGEGTARTIVQAGDNSLTGLERREVFVSATDVEERDVGSPPKEDDYKDSQGNVDEDAYNAAVRAYNLAKQAAREDYLESLKTRASQKLDDMDIAVNFECVATPRGNFVYRTDYDLGDIVTVEKESWGIKYDLRVTELQEIYEYGMMRVAPTLGSTLPESVDWQDI